MRRRPLLKIACARAWRNFKPGTNAMPAALPVGTGYLTQCRQQSCHRIQSHPAWAKTGSLTIENPALVVCNCSFEHVLQHVGRAGLLSTSSEGVSAAAPAWVPGSYYYGSRISCLITNRAG